MSARYNRDSRRTPGWTPRFLRGLEKTNKMKPAFFEKQRPNPQRRSRFLKKTKIAFVSPTAPRVFDFCPATADKIDGLDMAGFLGAKVYIHK